MRTIATFAEGRRTRSNFRMSSETTRRRLDELACRGLCIRDERGARIDAAILERSDVQRLASRNSQDLKRMLATLAEFGVLQAWRSPRAAAA